MSSWGNSICRPEGIQNVSYGRFNNFPYLFPGGAGVILKLYDWKIDTNSQILNTWCHQFMTIHV